MDAEQLVYIEPDDEIETIWGKLEFCPSSHIVVLIPRGNRCLRSAMNMKLLWRQAHRLSDIPVIVTPDRSLIRRARAEGFDTFSSVKRYYRSQPLSSALQGRQHAPVPDWARETWYTRFGRPALTLGPAAALLAVAVLLVLPGASVEVVPAGRLFNTLLDMTIDTGVGKPEPELRAVPGQVLEASPEGSMDAATTGRRFVSDAVPRGNVSFINRSDIALDVPRGTVVMGASPKARFVTLGSLYLPPRASRIISVQAEGAGSIVARAGEVSSVEGPLNDQVTVSNEEPIAGGKQTEVSYVTLLDRSRLEENLRKDLVAKAQARMRQSLEKGSSLVLLSNEPTIVEARFDKEVDEQAQLLTLFTRLTLRGMSFRGEDVNQLSNELLAQQAGSVIPNGRLLASSVKLNPPEVTKREARSVALRIKASATIVAPVDLSALKRRLLGRSLGSAERLLANQSDVIGGHITTTPAWVRWVPVLPPRVDMRLAEPQL